MSEMVKGIGRRPEQAERPEGVVQNLPFLGYTRRGETAGL